MKGSDIKDIIADIESLTAIVDFGNKKLTNFFAAIEEKEQELLAITSRDVLAKFISELHALRGSVQVTTNSLQEWKEKAGQHLHKLHDAAKAQEQGSDEISYDFQQVAEDTTTLLRKITSQLQDITHQNNKLVNLGNHVQNKKNQLQLHIDRSKSIPPLTDDVEAVAH